MDIKVIKTDKAPAAIGPYSQAVKTGNMFFASGMLPINVKTGELLAKDIKEATQTVFSNISNLLDAEGLTLSNVVKTTVFMTDLSEFSDMNQVYGEFFKDHLPARSTVQVAALPKGAQIEVEVIAITE